jgi:formylmethanofuran dehydrogenase subunit C
MTGGLPYARMSAGLFLGTGATGRTIMIDGNADEWTNSALYGHTGGLAGATLEICGQAGSHPGERMRSGFIVAEAVSDYAGARMVAGTLIAGTGGNDPCYAMRRGTLLVR